MVSDYGFMLNNELTDFDSIPGGMNEVQPNKRPVSCKSPTIIFKDGEPILTLGSPGGPTIISSVVQTIINVLDLKMDLKAAIEEPRIFTPMGPHIEWEPGMDMTSKGHLESMGFAFNEVPHSIGNVQAIQINPDGSNYGAADSAGKAVPWVWTKQIINRDHWMEMKPNGIWMFFFFSTSNPNSSKRELR